MVSERISPSSSPNRTDFRIAGVWLNLRSLRSKLCLTRFPSNSGTGSSSFRVRFYLRDAKVENSAKKLVLSRTGIRAVSTN